MSTVQIAENIFCQFTQIDFDLYECKNCGTRVRLHSGQGAPIFPCKRTFIREKSGPSLGSKVLNFAKSAINHVANGAPLCTEDQIEKRYSVCNGCEFLQDNSCTKCGCPISRTKHFVSKIAWADQECPIGKWKKEI